jgi:hypothetical protein
VLQLLQTPTQLILLIRLNLSKSPLRQGRLPGRARGEGVSPGQLSFPQAFGDHGLEELEELEHMVARIDGLGEVGKPLGCSFGSLPGNPLSAL